MDIMVNQKQFLEEMSLLKHDLFNVAKQASIEKHREEFKRRYSQERFKEFFSEKAAIHIVFKYFLIRMVEESMGRVKEKLNEEGLKKWHDISKNYRNDYDLLYEIAVNDVRREKDLEAIFEETIYDREVFRGNGKNVITKYIPRLSKYDFRTLDESATLTLIDKLYDMEKRKELNDFFQPSPIITFLLNQVGIEE
ncbi:hypothetical protein HLK66_25110 [Niallia circulans]|uniref:hypothetical protein n=1 Tax=Niallia circulans TaxID=1397 RepID=UPI0014902D3E|nr:hypothetical protein [Niallia circulans]QJX64608.1 hypothetical protein HLK66_25110 [Niallia circulans]